MYILGTYNIGLCYHEIISGESKQNILNDNNIEIRESMIINLG